MPYKDPEWKKEWERLHCPQRLARRRELRRIEVTQQAAQPEVPSTQHGGYGFLIPIVAGDWRGVPPVGGHWNTGLAR